jgi:hypothetical protein
VSSCLAPPTALTKETQERAWTPFVSNGGERLPYGLGWFVTDYHGLKLVWHYGNWGTGFSAMYLKMPEKNVSIVMLANSEALADQGGQELTNSVFVCSFLGLCHSCHRHREVVLDGHRCEGRTSFNILPLSNSYIEQTIHAIEATGNQAEWVWIAK